MKPDLTYVDKIHEFEGLWGAPSLCGLLTCRNDAGVIVIATELYDKNPGTSVTEFATGLAEALMKETKADPDAFTFIIHCPETGSKLSIYEESFDVVHFDVDGARLVNPRFERVTRGHVDTLLARGREGA